MVVDTGSRAQEPPSEAASPSSSDSFILLPAPTEAPSPLTGYLPYLQADPTRSSGAPYLAEATLQPPLPSSAQVPEYPLQGCEPAGPADQPPVPPRHSRDTARLLSPCNISAEGRILRAWKAGQAAGKVLRGELDFVDATSVSATGSTACSVPPRSLSLVCCILLLPTNRCQVSFRGGGRCPTPSLARPRPGPTLRGPRSPTLSDGALGPGPCL